VTRLGFWDFFESLKERAEFWDVSNIFSLRVKGRIPRWLLPACIACVIGLVIIVAAVVSTRSDSPPKNEVKNILNGQKASGGTDKEKQEKGKSPEEKDSAKKDDGTDEDLQSLEKDEYVPENPVFPSFPLTAAARTGERTPTRITSPSMKLIFKCYGRAHGVGMCMDGVSALARSGYSATQILSFYYSNISFGTCDEYQKIRVKGRNGKILTLSLREYLYRLTEEPDSFPYEGLKALYIAARTYTLSCIRRGKHSRDGFDICSSGGCCQAFDENKNISKFPMSIRAVNETAGQIMLYEGEPIIAAYCGSCGGHTENNEDIWGSRPMPYLRGKPDPYCSSSPGFVKTLEINAAQLESKLSSSPATNVGRLKLIDLTDRTPGGRVRTARLGGSLGEKTVKGSVFAKALGFRSTKIEYTIIE